MKKLIFFKTENFFLKFLSPWKRIRELEQKNSELEELNKEKDFFFSIITHDLKNPFLAMKGFAEILNKEFGELINNPLEMKNIVLELYNSINNTYDFFEKLVLLSISQSEGKDNKIKFNIVNLILESVELNSGQAFMKKIKVFFDYSKEDVINVFSNPDRIRIVIGNLISNALKFTKNNSEIKISVDKKDSNNLLVSVTDDGIGIKNPENFFDSRIVRNGTNDEKGTGLGLIFCKKFVEVDGGKLYVESGGIGKGSTFSFTIPLVN